MAGPCLFCEIVAAAADCVLDWERHGVIDAMNRCNRHLEPPAPAEPVPDVAADSVDVVDAVGIQRGHRAAGSGPKTDHDGAEAPELEPLTARDDGR